jgi:hypothetical protein
MFPLVNTDIKMPKKLFEALGIYETVCAVTGVKKVSEDDVKKYLAENHGDDMANQFKPEYLSKDLDL